MSALIASATTAANARNTGSRSIWVKIKATPPPRPIVARTGIAQQAMQPARTATTAMTRRNENDFMCAPMFAGSTHAATSSQLEVKRFAMRVKSYPAA